MSEDVVNKPRHYNQNGIEVIDVIETYAPDSPHLANVIKYVCRCDYKGKKLEDLRKARWYLNRCIDNLERDTVCVGCLAELKPNLAYDRDEEGRALCDDCYASQIDFELDGYYSLVPKGVDVHVPPNKKRGPPVYVHPSPDRIAGDDDAAMRIKADYYAFSAGDPVCKCSNAACRAQLYANDTYLRDWKGRRFCTYVCLQMLNEAESR